MRFDMYGLLMTALTYNSNIVSEREDKVSYWIRKTIKDNCFTSHVVDELSGIRLFQKDIAD